MLTLYVFSLVFGGGLLLLSLLSGEGGEGDLDLDGGLELDSGLDLDGGLDLDAGVDGGVEVDTDSELAAGKIFSLRGLIYAAFGFGAAGTLLTLVGVTAVVTAVAAGVSGVLSSTLVTSVFNYLKRTDSGAHPGDAAFIGAPGRVVLPLEAERPGAVVVERGGREVRLRALPHASAPSDPGDWREIMVVEVARGIALVVPMEEGKLLEP